MPSLFAALAIVLGMALWLHDHPKLKNKLRLLLIAAVIFGASLTGFAWSLVSSFGQSVEDTGTKVIQQGVTGAGGGRSAEPAKTEKP